MRLSAIAAPLIALIIVVSHAQPVMAAFLFFSATGSGTTCSQSSPCTIQTAISQTSGGEISCANSGDTFDPGTPIMISASVTIDCAGTTGSFEPVVVNGPTVVLRNVTVWGASNLITQNGGTLVLENVHFSDGENGSALIAQPTSASTLVLRNCLIDSMGAAVIFKPQAGGSLSVRLDHVTITDNSGGGIKVDTTNGPVTLDITDSEISSNGGNGINVVGDGSQAMVSIKNSVIAKNGAAGVQANGANAGVLLQTTLLDQNAAGATAAVNGGHISTYGNNSIVGSVGSGFTGSASLQ
jgi:hypothetical protein